MGRIKQKRRSQSQSALALATTSAGAEEAAASGVAIGRSAEGFGDGAYNSTDVLISQSSAQSSWFSEVKWVSRHHQKLLETSQDAKASSSKTVDIPEKASPDYVLKPASTESKPLPKEKTHDSLLAELNQIKEQLMPAAQMCADAINKYQSTKKAAPEYEFRQARSTCNPYERLGETFSKNYSNRNTKKSRKRKNSHLQAPCGLSQFINRSAIKLANIDALIGFSLTSTAMDQEQDPGMQTKQKSKFVFVDLCGAPGGFSEYILYRYVHPANIQNTRQSPNNESHENGNNCIKVCHGFGMSLSGSNNDGKGLLWNLDHLKRYHLSTNNTHDTSNTQSLSYHVCNGADNTGSIYSWKNILQLQREIISTVSARRDSTNCHKPLANLVVADGGFDAQRDSNNQEALAHKIIVSQTAAALSILRPGGKFVLKMFGFREEATRIVLQYLYDCFDKMTFVKPILSRPASAERYLVCQGYNCPGVEWDGFVWSEKMITPPKASGETKACTQNYTPLDDLMDSFDLDMVQLNIDTCRSIINYLHAKKESIEEGDNAAAYENQKQYINIREYEATWRLL
mmetsp:Transcript_27091/g.65109  ORF Transcript_27091/g.65109 Transcript_27091/m.65109 type:complete len:571 (+) Transcript_27091:218-1930(+)